MKSMLYILLLCLGYGLNGHSQNTPEASVRAFFQAMRDADVATMDSLMTENCTLQSTGNSDGNIQTLTKVNWLRSMTNAQKGQLDEQIANLSTQANGWLATVWMDYAFYLNDAFSHCGVNNFTLTKVKGVWKILHIADTRSEGPCIISDTKLDIDRMLDSWHAAASTADSAGYFGLMTPSSIYIGTDASEVWTKGEFLAFASPYFAKGKAWDFKKIARNIYSDDYATKVWFDEILDTWMGPCRGSGLVVKTPLGWQIEHYVLSVTVPNEDIDAFVKLLQK